jgi:hypothetical protein
MVMAGLLWYDDDARRPLAAKIIEAVGRYRERVGFEPTVCQLPPQQLTALYAATASRPKRARTPVIELPRRLRLEPDEHLHPNTFLLGMGEEDIAIPNPLLAEDDEAPRRTRSAKHPLPARAVSGAAPPAPPLSEMAATRSGRTKAAAKAPATTPKIARATTPVAVNDSNPTTAKVAKAKKSAQAESPVAAKSRVARAAAVATSTAVKRTRPPEPAKPAASRPVKAKKAVPNLAQQATLWDTTSVNKTTLPKAPAKPANVSSEKPEKGEKGEKGEKITRVAKPVKTDVRKTAKSAGFARPAKSAMTKVALTATKAAVKATKPAKASMDKSARPTKHADAMKPAIARHSTPKITHVIKSATDKPVRPAKPTADQPAGTAKSLAKTTARATITPAAQVKPRAARKSVGANATSAGTQAPHTPSKSETPRRRLARSA